MITVSFLVSIVSFFLGLFGLGVMIPAGVNTIFGLFS